MMGSHRDDTAKRRTARDDGGEDDGVEDHAVVTDAEPGRLTVYYARIAGALDRLISLHGGEVPDKPGRDAKKAEPDRGRDRR
ncbi:MAG: hypothetical protein ACREER_03835 [Alphaproteobacteria bacterium]